MRDYKQDLFDIKGTTYITSIPLDEFENLEDLENFVKIMNDNGVDVALKNEKSNLYQGILVSAFDNEKCEVKEYVFK